MLLFFNTKIKVKKVNFLCAHGSYAALLDYIIKEWQNICFIYAHFWHMDRSGQVALEKKVNFVNKITYIIYGASLQTQY